MSRKFATKFAGILFGTITLMSGVAHADVLYLSCELKPTLMREAGSPPQKPAPESLANDVVSLAVREDINEIVSIEGGSHMDFQEGVSPKLAIPVITPYYITAHASSETPSGNYHKWVYINRTTGEAAAVIVRPSDFLIRYNGSCKKVPTPERLF